MLSSTIELGSRAFVLFRFLISRFEDPDQKAINAASTIMEVGLADGLEPSCNSKLRPML